MVQSPRGAAAPVGEAVRFVALSFASAVLLNLPLFLARQGVVAGPPERFMAPTVLSFFAPAIIAVALSARSPGGVRGLMRPFAVWRVRPVLYLVALFAPALLLVAAQLLYALAGGRGPSLYPPANAEKWLAMLLIPFTEQVAWRGYAYPRLLAKLDPVRASLVTGMSWALFHVTKHALMGTGLPVVLTLVVIVLMTAGTVFYTWLSARAGGSMLIVVVANAGAYLDNSMDALPNDATPLLLHTAGYVAVATLLVIFDRRAFGRPGV